MFSHLSKCGSFSNAMPLSLLALHHYVSQTPQEDLFLNHQVWQCFCK